MISAPEEATRGDVRNLLADRIKLLRSHAEERPLVVQWRLAGIEHLAPPTKRHELAAELLEWLRKEYGPAKPPVWSLGVEFASPELPEAWFSEDSMVGDFLRGLQLLVAADAKDIDLAPHIPDRFRTVELAALSNWTADDHREILHEVALTGAQLLGADDRD